MLGSEPWGITIFTFICFSSPKWWLGWLNDVFISLWALPSLSSHPLSVTFFMSIHLSVTHSLFLFIFWCVLCVGGHWVNVNQFHAIFKQVNYVEPYKDWGQAEGQLPRSTLCCSILFCVFFSKHLPWSLLFSFLYSLGVLPSFTFLFCSVVIFPAAPVVEESLEIKA